MNHKCWVQAELGKNANVKGYSVYYIDNIGDDPKCINTFRITKRRSWQIAFHLANKLRDDMNNNIQ